MTRAAPKIERPEDVPAVLEYYAYSKAFIECTTPHLTNIRDEFADAFVAAFTAQFPDEVQPVLRIQAEDGDARFCVLIRKGLRDAVDWDRLRKAIAAAIDGPAS